MEYTDVEIEFIKRTLKLIDQYEYLKYNLHSDERFEVTLLTNCLLGLIVFPKEKSFSKIPTDRLLQSLKCDMGIHESYINPKYKTLRHLIEDLRNAIAHLNLKFESDESTNEIKKIVFLDDKTNPNETVAGFYAVELVSFIRYYSNWLIRNIQYFNSKNKNI